MFKEKYQRLLDLIAQSQENQSFSLEEVLGEAVLFFEELRKTYPSASKEAREEMIEMMGTLHARLQEVSKSASQAMGMTEEEFQAYGDNPSHFTPEQWRMVQETRRRLYDSARKLSESLEAEKRSQPVQNKKVIPPSSRPIRAPTRRAKRSEWKKS